MVMAVELCAHRKRPLNYIYFTEGELYVCELEPSKVLIQEERRRLPKVSVAELADLGF
jgi:hypothetical protein